MRHCFENAVLEYGENDVSIWLDYIKFESQFIEGHPEEAAKIFERAKNCLRDNLVENFIVCNVVTNK